jgi:hypothetical protein
VRPTRWKYEPSEDKPTPRSPYPAFVSLLLENHRSRKKKSGETGSLPCLYAISLLWVPPCRFFWKITHLEKTKSWRDMFSTFSLCNLPPLGPSVSLLLENHRSRKKKSGEGFSLPCLYVIYILWVPPFRFFWKITDVEKKKSGEGLSIPFLYSISLLWVPPFRFLWKITVLEKKKTGDGFSLLYALSLLQVPPFRFFWKIADLTTENLERNVLYLFSMLSLASGFYHSELWYMVCWIIGMLEHRMWHMVCLSKLSCFRRSALGVRQWCCVAVLVRGTSYAFKS